MLCACVRVCVVCACVYVCVCVCEHLCECEKAFVRMRMYARVLGQ